MKEKKDFGGYAYDELGYPQMHEILIPLLVPGKKALDLGIGTGHTSSSVAFAGLSITGVDINKWAINQCWENYEDAGLEGQLSTVCADASDFMSTLAKDNQFDLVIMSDFLMFLPKKQGRSLIVEAYKALKSGGLLWITTKSTGDYFFQEMSKGQEPVDDETFMANSHCSGSMPFCFYFPGEIEKMLEPLGARVLFSSETENSAGGLFNIILIQKS